MPKRNTRRERISAIDCAGSVSSADGVYDRQRDAKLMASSGEREDRDATLTLRAHDNFRSVIFD